MRERTVYVLQVPADEHVLGIVVNNLNRRIIRQSAEP
jgi:hypothetical protein